MEQGRESARSGALAESASAFRKAIETDPRAAEAWNDLGVILIRQGALREGIEALRRALGIKPAHPEAHRNIAVALEREGKAGEAVRHYRAFLTHGPPDHPDRARVQHRLNELGPVRADQ